jgi:hypothetical protein
MQLVIRRILPNGFYGALFLLQLKKGAGLALKAEANRDPEVKRNRIIWISVGWRQDEPVAANHPDLTPMHVQDATMYPNWGCAFPARYNSPFAVIIRLLPTIRLTTICAWRVLHEGGGPPVRKQPRMF